MGPTSSGRIAPQLGRRMLKFIPVNDRVLSLYLLVGDSSLIVIPAEGLNRSTEYPAFLESLGGVLDEALTGKLQRTCGQPQ